MKQANKFISMLAAGVILSSCGGGDKNYTPQANTTGGGGGNTVYTPPLSIDAMTTVPVINGSTTQGTLYIRNSSDTTINNISFSLGSATTKTSIKMLLANVGFHINSAEDAAGFILLNPERCAKVSAHASCAINFTTPNLTFANQGNSLVKLSYLGPDGTLTTSQVVNYAYTDLNSINGVNFSGGLSVSGPQGSIQHVVGYLYAGGKPGTLYNNVNLTSTNPTTTLSNAFINGQQIAAGEVIAIEFAVALQNDKASTVSVIPSWTSTNMSNKLQSTGIGQNYGTALTLTLAPAQNTLNYIFGDLPLLNAPTSAAASISVMNNGNTNASGSLTVLKSGSNPNDLTVTGNCTTLPLLANAANSCQFSFSTTSSTTGSAVVEYRSAGVTVGSQSVYWTNDTPIPEVSSKPVQSSSNASPIIIAKTESQALNSIQFNISNLGKAPLNTVTYPVTNTGGAIWTQESTTCTSTLAASPASAATCSISGHLTGVSSGLGKLYISVLGTLNGESYSFTGLPLTYNVTLKTPFLIITPINVSMTIYAGSPFQAQTFNVTNGGDAPAVFTDISMLESSANTVKPTINPGGGSCSNSTTLAESASCVIYVKYGPADFNKNTNESGVATISINYNGGFINAAQNVQDPINYNLVGNDSYIVESVSATTNLTGAGTVGSPYLSNANLNSTITLTYTNMSGNFDLLNFNLQTNNLPSGIGILGGTCPINTTVSTLLKGATCTLILGLDRTTLATIAGSITYSAFALPPASWTTQMGVYKQAVNSLSLSYLQPSVTSILSKNNGNIESVTFESTTLTTTVSNIATGVTPLTFNIAGVKSWPVTVINPSSNCTINNSNYAVSCTLESSTTSAKVDYIMPTNLNAAESMNIPLVFSIANTPFAYLNPPYIFINYLAPTWGFAGNANFQTGGAKYTSLVIANDGTAYVAYTAESSISGFINQVLVKKLVIGASIWTDVGLNGLVSTQGATDISLTLSALGVPYVAYIDNANSGRITVQKYASGSWQALGGLGAASLSTATELSLAIASDDTPYISYKTADLNAVFARKFNGSSWVAVTTSGDLTIPGGTTQDNKLAFNSNNVLYVAHAENPANGGKATVLKLSGGEWINVGNPSFSAGAATYINLAIPSVGPDTGKPYIAYRDAAYDQITVMKFDGTNWVNVGNPGFSYGSSPSAISLAIKNDGTPYVTYSPGGSGVLSVLMKFDKNSNSWLNVGGGSFINVPTNYNSLAIPQSGPNAGMPYIAYRSRTTNLPSVVYFH